MPKTVYRYDDECYSDGEIIRPRGDSFHILTEVQKVVELQVRTALPDGVSVRANSVYTWENEETAKRLWKLSGRKYLYELEVEDSSIRHVGDLDLYSAATDAVRAGESAKEAIEAYCKGEFANAEVGALRLEILVSEARVLRRIASL